MTSVQQASSAFPYVAVVFALIPVLTICAVALALSRLTAGNDNSLLDAANAIATVVRAFRRSGGEARREP